MNIRNKKGFTMVELGIVFVIVGILTLNSVMAYRKFVKEAMISEGKMLVSSIAKVERLYHAESNSYHPIANASYNEIPEIDSRHNKYFSTFSVNVPGDVPDSIFTVITTSQLNILCCVQVVLHVFENKPSILIVNIGSTSTTTTDTGSSGDSGTGSGNNGATVDGDDNNQGSGQEKNGNNGKK